MIKSGVWVLGTIVAMMASAAFASDHPSLETDKIRAQQQQIRADAQARSGRYAKLSPKQRSELAHQQDRVEELLRSDVKQTTDLNEYDQIALFNSLESIESIINNAEDERMICERHKPTGSKRPVTTCRTAAQRKAEREEAMKDFGKSNLECNKTAMTCY